MTDPDAISLTGPELREMFISATAWLERHVQQVNAVNVFPVPDGDTGTNMYATMRKVVEGAQSCVATRADAMLAAMSHGALMGGTGNSGVILYQIIRGIAATARGTEVMSADLLVNGLEQGASLAYAALNPPVEGTILTVARETAEAARAHVSGKGASIISVIEVAVEAAKASVARTPTLLPVLAEAGVVDAGGLGLSILLEGMLRHLKGESPADAATAETVGEDWLAATGARHETAASLYGYCTEILISGSNLHADSIRDRIMNLGDSVIVVGDDQLVRVHVHTDDPGAALTQGTSVGSLTQVKVDNIRKQAERFVEMHQERHAESPPATRISTVAVVAGDGMAAVFESLGCTKIVSGGPTMNPSTGDILKAVDACPSDDVIVLPNDKNIILAARQAVDVTSKRLHVVGTRSMPQGIAALFEADAEDDVETIVEAMEATRQNIRTIEVTRAVRSVTLGGVRVEEGQIIAIVDDEIKLSAPSPEEAVVSALEGLLKAGTSLITLYYGADTEASAAEALAADLRERFAGHEVEVVLGGQPHYDYIVSLE